MTENFDILYIVLLGSGALLLVAISLLIRTIICYFIDLSNLPKNKTIINKVRLDNDNLYVWASMYRITVVLRRNNVVLNYTFEVDRQTYETCNIGDIYEGGFLNA